MSNRCSRFWSAYISSSARLEQSRPLWQNEKWNNKGCLHMELKKLDKKVLKLWYIRATFILLILLGVFIAAAVIPLIAGAPDDITLVIILCVATPVALLFALKAISAVLCYKNNCNIQVNHIYFIFFSMIALPFSTVTFFHFVEVPIYTTFSSDRQ